MAHSFLSPHPLLLPLPLPTFPSNTFLGAATTLGYFLSRFLNALFLPDFSRAFLSAPAHPLLPRGAHGACRPRGLPQ